MKTTITLCVDADVKEKVMPIIQNQMNTSLSKVINEMLKRIIERNKEDNSK